MCTGFEIAALVAAGLGATASGVGAAVSADSAEDSANAALDFKKSQITKPENFGGTLGAEGSTYANARKPFVSVTGQDQNFAAYDPAEELKKQKRGY